MSLQSEEKVKQNEERLRAIFEASQDGILVEDNERIIYVNKSYLGLFGYDEAKELIGQHISVVISPEDTERVMEFGRSRLSGEHPPSKYEFKGRRKNGKLIKVEASVSKSTVADKTFITTILRDITERKRQEEKLREFAQRIEQQSRIFDTTLSSITDFAYIFDKAGRFAYSNQPLLDLLGIKFEEILGKNFFDLKYPDDLAERLQKQIQQVFDTKEKLVDETPFISPTGISGYYEYIFSPVIATDGSVEVVAGSTRDITQRKRIEEALRESEEKSRNILESITDAFLSIDREWRFTYINRQAERLLERKSSDLLGKNMWDEYPALNDSEFGKAYKQAAYQRLASTVISFYPDHDRWYEAHVYPAPDGITIYFRNVTERKQAEEILRRSHEVLEARVLKRTKELEKVNEERERALHQLVTVQEDERQRIARDLHDHLGQQLTALRLKLEILKKMSAGDESLYKQIDEAVKVARQLDSDVDFLAWQMRPTTLDDLGIVAALAHYVRQWAMHSDISAEFNADRFGKIRLTDDAETNFYRITQEALNNISKHAQASSVNVLLEPREGFAVLIIEDDGIGFEPDKQTSDEEDRKQMGLIGMQERAALIGGKLEIESAKGEGTTIFVSVPISGGKKEKVNE
jgi:PAS domain S-box-containing protein